MTSVWVSEVWLEVRCEWNSQAGARVMALPPRSQPCGRGSLARDSRFDGSAPRSPSEPLDRRPKRVLAAIARVSDGDIRRAFDDRPLCAAPVVPRPSRRPRGRSWERGEARGARALFPVGVVMVAKVDAVLGQVHVTCATRHLSAGECVSTWGSSASHRAGRHRRQPRPLLDPPPLDR